MTAPDKTNLAYAAIHSRRLILQLLRKEPLSRRQLIDLTGLRGSTITYIVRDLMENDLVRSIGKRESKTVGKKQILLEVNPQVGWVAGFGISRDWGFMAYMDLAGNLVDKDHFQINANLPDILKEMTGRIHQWASAQGGSIGKMLGVGLGIPGVINVDAGQIKLSTMLQLQKFPVRDIVAEQMASRVCVDNNVNFAAQAEARMGSAVNLKNFVYFHLNVSAEAGAYTFKSIGSTLCLDGKPYRGAHYSAGEIERLLQETIPVNSFTAAELLMLGDAEADITDGLKQLAVGTGRTLSTICDLIDPQAVIIGSNTPVCNRKLIDIIQAELNRHIEPVPDRVIRVIASELGDDGVAMGAAITVLDQAVSNLEDGVLSGLNHGS